MRTNIRFVYLTMDGGHDAAVQEAAKIVGEQYPINLHISQYSLAKMRDDNIWQRLEKDMQEADFIFGCMIFSEEFVRPMEAILDQLDKPMLFITSNPAMIYRTKIGKLSLKPPDEDEEPSLIKKWMQRLRPRKKGKDEGQRQTALVKNFTKFMKYLPGMMRDLHTFIASHDYWLHSSPDNLARMMLMFIDRYVDSYTGKIKVEDAVHFADMAIYHPDAPQMFDNEESYRAWRKKAGKPIANGTAGAWDGSVGLLTQRAIILSGNTEHLDNLIYDIEAQGIEARTTYSTMLDFRPAMQKFFSGEDESHLPKVDAMLNTVGFPLVGGPAGTQPDLAKVALQKMDRGYFDMIPLGFQRVEDWQSDEVGLNPMQVALNIALPELDGIADPVVFGGPTQKSEKFIALESEQHGAVGRIARRIRLRRKENADKKVAVVLFNFPPNLGNAGTAAFLDVFQSLHRLLNEMRDAGYSVADIPQTPDELRQIVAEGNAQMYGVDGNVAETISLDDYRRLFPWYSEIEDFWGHAPGELLTNGREFYILGAHFGNVFVALQPSFGYERDPMRLLMGKDASPHHGFAAFYTWLDHCYDADAVVHFGTHGALEFMPGKQTGISADCWSSRLIGNLPNFYYYCVNNPSEGSIAKRRSAATLVSYMVPPMQQAGLYKGLRRLKDSIDTYHKRADDELLKDIQAQAHQLGIIVDESDDYIAKLNHELISIESRMIPLGLHVLGQAPSESELIDTLSLVVAFNPINHPNGRDKLPTLPALIAQAHGWDYRAIQETLKTDNTSQERWGKIDAQLRETIRLFVTTGSQSAENYLAQMGINTKQIVKLWDWLEDLQYRIVHDEEIAGLLHALNGGFIMPSPGNDIVRNDAIVPTGRNIHALDPYRIPTPTSIASADKLVRKLLARLQAEEGKLPETVAMVLWGTDNLKSDGEGIAQCLNLLGAKPIEDELGNISNVELIPLAELGRPRIDIVMTVSGIFRDLFHHQAGLLDKAVRLAAHADEPLDMNFVRKHSLEHADALGVSLDEATARVYCNASGSYGANVNHMVDGSTWEDDDELADVFLNRKSFAYRPDGGWHASREVMTRSLSTVDAAFQNIDSFELGISDVDHYYEYLGGVTKSVEKLSGKRPSVMVADAISLDERLASLEQMVRLETRAKLLNPKWYESMMSHGYEGVREIEHRVSNTYGWSATADAVEGWVYDDVADTFMLDEEMRQRMANANPHATAAIARRLLEVNARGFWDTDENTLDQLREIYGNLEDQLEGIVN
ncbi:MAG: magnesium chelatase subunit H [Chloroflexota bacterium]